MRTAAARSRRSPPPSPRRLRWRRRCPAREACPVFPADNAWNRRVDTLPVRRARPRRSPRSGRRRRCTPTSARGSGTAARSGSRSRSSAKAQRKSTVRFEYADESDRGPYPIPAGVQDRGRRRGRRRPACAHRRPRRVPALRAVRPAPRRRPLDGRVGRDLGSPLEPAATRRLDVGRRRRAADPARASRATTRSRRAGSTTPCASRSRARDGRTSGRRGTTRAR